MKMTVNDAVNSHECLKKFGEKSIPMSVAVTVAYNQRLLNDVVGEFEKRRGEILEKFGTPDKETGGYKLIGDARKKYNEAGTKLAEEEVDLDLKQITMTALSDDFETGSNDIMFLLWMFKDAPQIEKPKTVKAA